MAGSLTPAEMPHAVVIRLEATTSAPVEKGEGADLSFRRGAVVVAVGGEGERFGDRLISAQVSKTASDEMVALLNRHASHADLDLDIVSRPLTETSESGSSLMFLSAADIEAIEAMRSPSDELLRFFQPAMAELLVAASRVAQTLRWVFNLMSRGSPIVDPRFTWSYDEQKWWPVVEADDSPLGFGEPEIVISPRGREIVQATIDDDRFVEPLGRQLLYEAADLQQVNPRAALVLAIAAAEVGVKDFAGGSSPERAWLLSEVVAPPLVKIVREYLAILTDARTHDGRVIPKAITSTLQRGVERRNEIVHRGLDAPDEKELEELLEAVNDFLYALDWLAGHKWAFGRMRTQTQNEWGQSADAKGSRF